MAKKSGNSGPERGTKTAAIKGYLSTHKKAMPKEVVAALKEQGVEVSPNMVSIVRAKSKIKKAKRRAKQATAAHAATAGAQSDNAAGLDSVLTLYKAARGQGNVPAVKVRQAFLSLVELLG